MPNKLPKFLDNHKICIICEGNEEYEYLNRLKNLKVWNEQYDISLVNASGNGSIPARYQDRYQNGADELVLVFCDTEKKPHEQYEDIKRKINVFHGVDNGVCYDAEPIYIKLIRQFNQEQITIAVFSFMNEHISSMLQFSLCEKKYRQLIEIMEEKNTSPAISEVIELIKNFKGLSNMRKDTMIKQKMASYKTLIK